MAGKMGPHEGYYQPPIARAPENAETMYQVCARVESILVLARTMNLLT